MNTAVVHARARTSIGMFTERRWPRRESFEFIGHGCLERNSTVRINFELCGSNSVQSGIFQLLILGLIGRHQHLQPVSNGASGGFGILALRFVEGVTRIDQYRNCRIVAQKLTRQVEAPGLVA